MEITKEATYKEAHIFAQRIVIAINCMDQSCAMDRVFSDPQFSPKYKIAPHFFRTAYHALRYRFEIEVNKLFEQKSKSFDNFKNQLSQISLIRSVDEEAYKRAKQIAKKDLEEIRIRRNKIHAHSDAETFCDPDIFSKQHPICMDVIRALLISMLNICNWVILCDTSTTLPQLYDFGNSDDFVRLFGCKTESEKQYNDLLKMWGC